MNNDEQVFRLENVISSFLILFEFFNSLWTLDHMQVDVTTDCKIEFETMKDMTADSLQVAGKIEFLVIEFISSCSSHFFIQLLLDNVPEKSVSSSDKLSDDSLEEATVMDTRPLWRQVLFSFAALIIVCALIGAAIGVGLGEDGVPDELVQWIALPGVLFVRAIRCCVIPLIFVTMVLGMFEMLEVGKASSVGWKTIVVFLSTTCVAGMHI